MGEFGFELEEIARLIRLVETRGLAELVFEEEDGRRLVIRGLEFPPVPLSPVSTPVPASSSAVPKAFGPPPATAPPAAAPGTVRRGPDGASGTEAEAALSANQVIIEAPMVGVFYRSTQPGAPPLIEVGDHVEVGQPIGLIEAMKVFSEIPSEYAGTVVRITDKNGQLVRQGEPLVYLRLESESAHHPPAHL